MKPQLRAVPTEVGTRQRRPERGSDVGRLTAPVPKTVTPNRPAIHHQRRDCEVLAQSSTVRKGETPKTYHSLTGLRPM